MGGNWGLGDTWYVGHLRTHPRTLLWNTCWHTVSRYFLFYYSVYDWELAAVVADATFTSRPMVPPEKQREASHRMSCTYVLRMNLLSLASAGLCKVAPQWVMLRNLQCSGHTHLKRLLSNQNIMKCLYAPGYGLNVILFLQPRGKRAACGTLTAPPDPVRLGPFSSTTHESPSPTTFISTVIHFTCCESVRCWIYPLRNVRWRKVLKGPFHCTTDVLQLNRTTLKISIHLYAACYSHPMIHFLSHAARMQARNPHSSTRSCANRIVSWHNTHAPSLYNFD